MKELTQIDRIALCLLRRLLSASSQTNENPMVGWRALASGLQDYLAGEGLAGQVDAAIRAEEERVEQAVLTEVPQ